MRSAKGIEVVGISVINAPGVMEDAVSSWLDNDADSCGIRWRTIDDCHFGGYAKTSPELRDFVATYSSLHDMPLEPVYTGKLFWWLNRELQSGQLQEDTEVILIHSGGLFPDEKP